MKSEWRKSSLLAFAALVPLFWVAYVARVRAGCPNMHGESINCPGPEPSGPPACTSCSGSCSACQPVASAYFDEFSCVYDCCDDHGNPIPYMCESVTYPCWQFAACQDAPGGGCENSTTQVGGGGTTYPGYVTVPCCGCGG
jgi:hypothetical protein